MRFTQFKLNLLDSSKRNQRKEALDFNLRGGKKWMKCPGLRQAKQLIKQPTRSRVKWLLGLKEKNSD